VFFKGLHQDKKDMLLLDFLLIFSQENCCKTLRKLFLEGTAIIHWNRDQKNSNHVFLGMLILSERERERERH